MKNRGGAAGMAGANAGGGSAWLYARRELEEGGGEGKIIGRRERIRMACMEGEVRHDGRRVVIAGAVLGRRHGRRYEHRGKQ